MYSSIGYSSLEIICVLALEGIRHCCFLYHAYDSQFLVLLEDSIQDSLQKLNKSKNGKIPRNGFTFGPCPQHWGTLLHVIWYVDLMKQLCISKVNVSATVGMSATVGEMSATVGECLHQWGN